MKKMRIIVMAVAMTFLIATGVYGYFFDTLKVNNHISLGDINIGLKEYEKKGNTEVAYSNPKKIVPGDFVSKIPRITNYAKPCWVRTRVVLDNNQEQTEGFSEEMLTGITSKWIKRGEYYYYTEILNRKESVDLFHGIKIPESWTEEHSDQKLNMVIQADAIQAANFTPDFSDMSPWGNQKIQLCIHEKAGAPLCRNPETKLSVEFNGKAHKLLAVPGDFFANIGTAMPGDQFEDTVIVSNTTDKEAEIFFRTEVRNEDRRNEVLKGIKLVISMNGKKIYQGTLDSPELRNDQSLGKFIPDEAGKFKFSLSIPVKWDNTYALREADVQWIFSVNEEEKIEKNPKKTVHIQSTKKSASVKTGDETEIEQEAVLLFCSILIIFIIMLFRRKGGRQK